MWTIIDWFPYILMWTLAGDSTYFFSLEQGGSKADICSNGLKIPRLLYNPKADYRR